jgi:hypothetical protein
VGGSLDEHSRVALDRAYVCLRRHTMKELRHGFGTEERTSGVG